MSLDPPRLSVPPPSPSPSCVAGVSSSRGTTHYHPSRWFLRESNALLSPSLVRTEGAPDRQYHSSPASLVVKCVGDGDDIAASAECLLSRAQGSALDSLRLHGIRTKRGAPATAPLLASCCSLQGTAVGMAERALASTLLGRGDRYYTYTELLAISRRFKQNPHELMITWILRVYDQGGPALSLSSGELALLGDLTGDAIFNYHCKTLRGGCQALLTWLLLAWRRRWESFLHFEATELPFRPWTTMEEGIRLVRELGVLDWIYREPPAAEPGSWPAPEDVPFTQGLQRRLLTAAPSELRLSLVSLLVKGMTVLEAVMEIQTIADVGLLWRQSQPGRAKLMLGPNPTRKDLTGWLLSHGVPRERVDKQPTKVLLELYIKEAKRSRGHPAYALGDEQPPPPPYSDQACGEEPPAPVHHD